MDELQDAIEDAQYVNAIACVEDGPRPMLNWEFPTEEQLATWKEKKNTELSKYISEGRRTRRRSSYSRLNVDRPSRPARSSSVVMNFGGNSTTAAALAAVGGEDVPKGSRAAKSSMQTDLEAAAATVAAADIENDEEDKDGNNDQTSPDQDDNENGTPLGGTGSKPNNLAADVTGGSDGVAVDENGKVKEKSVTMDDKSLMTVGGGGGGTNAKSGGGGLVRLKSPPLESYEYVCSQPLGFFLFAQYVKDIRKDYLRMNFVEDTLLYRRVRGSHNREHRAKDIALTYLVDKTQPLSSSSSSGGVVGSVRESYERGSHMSAISTTQHDNTSATPADKDNNMSPTSTDPAAIVSSPTNNPVTTTSNKKSKSKRYTSKSSHASDDVSILNMDKELVIQEIPNDPTVCNIPQKKDIVEYDVARLEDNALKKLGLSEIELEDFLEQNLDLSPKCRSLVKVKMDGTALRRALKRCGIPYTCPTKNHSVGPAHGSRGPNNEKKCDQNTSTDDPGISQGGEEGRHFVSVETAPLTASREGAGKKTNATEDAEATSTLVEASLTKTSVAESSNGTALTEGAADNVADDLEELKVSGDRDLFDELELIVMEGLAKQYWNDFLLSKEYNKLLNFWWYRDRKVIEDDFFLMRVLGRGGFGLVHACKKGTSGKLFAMKVMNKKRIKLKKSEQLTVNERMALAAVDSPFVVKLSYAFQSKDDIFLILDLMTGGDLGFHLHQKGKFTKRECLYFSARIMFGLQAIHDRRFVYRDLKPENVLVGDDGRVKLSDLGLATKVTPTLHGAAGTRGYWAPEMLRRDHKGRRKAYGHTVDWFSFGCCLYEFISGFNPFRSQDALRFGMNEGMDSKERALDCATLKMEPSFDPARFDHDAADLCLKLLDKNEKTRIGLKGCQEIMSHPYYRDMNWEAIISDRMKPPFIPPKDVNAASQSEIGTFAEDRTYHETQLEKEDEQIYKYWDWTNPTAYDAEIIEFLIHERRTGKPLLPSDPMTPCCCSVL